MSIDLTSLSAREVLSAVYIGYYNRAADPAGIQFWEQVISDTSLDLEAVATDFAGQAETLAVHPFFADPATSTPDSFITSLYLNLFNRDPDEAGLEFWSDQLEAAIAGTGTFSVGEIIVKIIEGAVDVDGGTQDRTTILNKIEVAQDWTDAAEANGGEFDAAAMASAKAIIADVTSDSSTVADAKATTDAFFAPAPVPGDTLSLTSATDVLTGTANDDQFNAYLQQNPFAGGVSNSLSSADRLDGGAGNDRLYAELAPEFLGVSAVGVTDIQPRLKNIEEIDLEARDSQFGDNNIVVDAKNITDHVEIGSYFSDGDLTIENLTTLTAEGAARNTADITVTMDHTDNFNSDFDASDLTVYFDNDYLITDASSVGQAFFFLLDQDAELLLQNGSSSVEGRLDEIDKNGIRFEIDGVAYVVQFDEALLEEGNANEVNSHAAFVAALQAPLQDLIDAGTLPEGTSITLTEFDVTLFDSDNLPLNRAGLQNATLSDLIPGITVTSADGSAVTPLGFAAPDEITGEFNIFGRFTDELEETVNPLSIDIDLHKAGRGGEGGDLLIGGKAQNTSEGIEDGIEVFNITVKGAGEDDPSGMEKPSNVGTITSTGNELEVVNISSEARPDGSTYASLTVRNGFDQNTFGDMESGDLKLVNANAFKGDLTLGDLDANMNAGRITNADAITATGGGKVTIAARLDGTETDQEYTIVTGNANDSVDVLVDGDALDHANSGLSISTGGGDDKITVNFDLFSDFENNQLNQSILNNVVINGEGGADVIEVDGVGVADIMGGSENDVIYTDGTGQTAQWAFNFDDDRFNFGSTSAEDLPGVETSLAYIGGATITVTLSGAGILDNFFAGGGVMVAGDGANPFENGYEATFTIGELINGNTYYGDQRDVNNAVIEAIEGHPILKNLLSVEIGANNTLVVTSKTSGDFAGSDLRISIDQLDATSQSIADAVVSEARSEFNNSALTVDDLFAAGTFATGRGYADGAPAGEAGDLVDSDDANDWYDGLSNAGDSQTTFDNLIRFANPDFTENDNFINGGDGDDLIVLSTDASDNGVPPFNAGGNNALSNGASNETVIMTGSNFGNDTVMNFTTTTEAFEFINEFEEALSFDINDGVVVNAEADNGTETFVVFQGLTDDGSPFEAMLSQGIGSDIIAQQLATAINDADNVPFTATVTGDVLTLTSVNGSLFDAGGVSFIVEDRDDNGLVTNTIDSAALGTLTLGTTITETGTFGENAGLDFLDFTAYLTSQFDSSPSATAAADTSDSNIFIPVTLDFDADTVEANEVAVDQFDNTDDVGETFAALTSTVVEKLFNNDGSYTGFTGDNNFGNLDAADYSVQDYDKSSINEDLIGNGKAVVMIENADNLGEYKVFEITWNGDEDLTEQVVEATEIGSLDFGTSLEGLAEVNLVGSMDYAALIGSGF